MSKKAPASRITVAIAAQTQIWSIESTIKLAISLEGELLGVFIEDTDILRAARLPFALELCRATNVVRRVDSTEMERELRANAERTRNLIAELAARSGAKWSFEVVRQNTASAVMQLAQETDVTVYPVTGTFRHGDGMSAATSTVTGRVSPASVVTLVDRSAASLRARQIAHRLGQIHRIPTHALAIAASRAGLTRLTERLSRGEMAAAQIHGLCRPTFSDIAAAVRSWRPAAVVLPISLVKGSSERLQELRESVEDPIVIVQ